MARPKFLAIFRLTLTTGPHEKAPAFTHLAIFITTLWPTLVKLNLIRLFFLRGKLPFTFPKNTEKS